MTTEGEEVAIHGLNIDLEMRCALGSIHHDGDTMRMGYLDDLFNRVDRAQHIADMGDAYQLRLR